MDDERRIREGLERVASEPPPAGRPPARFRARARRRMALTASVLALAVAAVGVGGVTGLRALDDGTSIGHGPATTPPTSPARPSPTPNPFVPHIAFQSDRAGNDDVWIIDANSDNPRNLTNDPAADRFPSWSPDGTKIVFASDRANEGGDIFVMDADGGNVEQLTDTSDPETAPAWSPDGTRVAYERVIQSDRGAPDLDEVWVMRPDGTDQHRLADGPFGFRLSWSPDGGELVFTGAGALFAIRPDGSGLRRIEGTQDGYDPSWCPDGHPIAFVRRPKAEDIWLVGPSGGESFRLTHGGNSGAPVWNSAGTGILFVQFSGTVRDPANGGPSAGISVMGPGGQSEEEVTPDDAHVRDLWPAPQPI